MNGVESIAASFTNAHPRAALMPYFTLGYPDPACSVDVVEAIALAGADLIELGIPFSDPLADGPTIQLSTQVALEQGMNLARCLDLTAQLRSRGLDLPLLLMGYVNPILAFGFERFVVEASAAGVDGFIVPDLPPEEADELEAICCDHGRALVYMLAPTSTEARIVQAAKRSQGFIYLVTLTGTTGVRDELPADLETFILRVRGHTLLPLAVGFGVSNPHQAQAVARLADGVIIGSALIEAVSRAPDSMAPQSAKAFVQNMRQALEELLTSGNEVVP